MAAVTITVTRTAPIAQDDAAQAAESALLDVSAPGVLANDSDPNGGSLTVTAVDGSASRVGAETQLASGALVTLNEDGSYRYDPNGQFEALTDGESRTDSFTYTVRDEDGEQATASVVVTIEGENDAPVAVLTAPEDGARVETGDDVPLEADVSDVDGAPAEVTFFADGASVGTDTNPGNGFSTTWTADASGSIELWAEATDNEGATARSDTAVVEVRPSAVMASVVQTFGDATEERSYRLVALPGQSGITLGSTVSGTSPDDWRAFEETGARGAQNHSRSECGTGGTSCSFGPARGFWLLPRQPWQVEQEVGTVPLRPDGTYRIGLQTGWNLISNPLEVDVPWSAVQDASGTNQALWRWTGRWQQVSTFRSAAEGEAYYFMDGNISQLVVPYPGMAASAPPATAGGATTPQKGAGEQSSTGEPATLTLSLFQDGNQNGTRTGTRTGGPLAGRGGLQRGGRHAPRGAGRPGPLRPVRSAGVLRGSQPAPRAPC